MSTHLRPDDTSDTALPGGRRARGPVNAAALELIAPAAVLLLLALGVMHLTLDGLTGGSYSPLQPVLAGRTGADPAR